VNGRRNRKRRHRVRGQRTGKRKCEDLDNSWPQETETGAMNRQETREKENNEQVGSAPSRPQDTQ